MLMEWIDKKPLSFVITLGFLVTIVDDYLDGPETASKMVIFGLSGFIITFLLVLILKVLTFRERGKVKNALDYRFPSMHMAIGTTMALIPSLFNPVFFALWVLIPLTAYNRIKLERHTKDEVLVGFIIGVIVLCCLYVFL